MPMEVYFTAEETIEIPVEEREIPISHYLRQPQRLVRAIADPNLMKQLSEDHYSLAMRPLNFLEIYHFQPTVVLKVYSDTAGTVHLNSVSCEIKGIDYINHRFSLQLKGKLFAQENRGKTYLKGKADLQVKVELPPPFWLTPKPFLETAGNGLLKSVLMRIKQRLLSQLLQDYRDWADSNAANQENAPQASVLPGSVF